MMQIEFEYNEYEQKFCLMHLKKRIQNGEDPYEILGINRTEKFYVDKLITGKTVLSTTLCERIKSDLEKEVNNDRPDVQT